MPAAIDTLEQPLPPFAPRAALRADDRRGLVEFTPARWPRASSSWPTVGAFVLLTARMFSGIIREEPDRFAGMTMLTIA
jgi:hypothetical protein